MLNLLKHELRSRWLATLLWGIGLAFFGTTYILIFPQVEEQITALADWEIYRAVGFDMGSFEGFIGSTVVLFIPVILGIYVIISSTSTLTGEEEEGTLELLLAMPLKRWQIVTAKAIALGLSIFLILVIVGLGDGLVLNLSRKALDTSITFHQLFFAVLSGWPLLLVVAMLGLFLGAYLPTQRAASITLTGFFILSYFMDNFASHIEPLSPLAPFSIFTYFDTSAHIFSEGAQTSNVLVLFGLAALFFALTLLSFRRRNVTVGAWPWQRAKIKD